VPPDLILFQHPCRVTTKWTWANETAHFVSRAHGGWQEIPMRERYHAIMPVMGHSARLLKLMGEYFRYILQNSLCSSATVLGQSGRTTHTNTQMQLSPMHEKQWLLVMLVLPSQMYPLNVAVHGTGQGLLHMLSWWHLRWHATIV
jgi:hypothetical protein